jgi:CheY-like chemotaxis protein
LENYQTKIFTVASNIQVLSDDPRSVRVLVVDDYAPMADHLAKVLCKAEYEAVAVYSAEEALRVAEQLPPQALITDIMMPGMNGVELVCAFGEKFPACRSVLMTATQLLPELFVGGIRVRVLQKPFEVDEVLQFVAGCVPNGHP